MSKWYFCSNHDVFMKDLKVVDIIEGSTREDAKEKFICKHGKGRMKTIRIIHENEIKEFYSSYIRA